MKHVDSDQPTYPSIFDGHNDTLLNLFLPERGGGRSFFERSTQGHLDLPRARDGGFGGGFFAIFVPSSNPRKDPSNQIQPPEGAGEEVEEPPAIGHKRAQQMTGQVIELLFQLERDSDGQFQVVPTAGELDRCLKQGTVAAIMHFEGAEAIASDLSNLEGYYEMGLRSLGLTWSRPNAFAHGVPFKFPHSPDTGPGLTDAGKALVRACNRLGVLLDLAHLNGRGFWDVAQMTRAPLVATHSGVHALCPSARNLTDKQLDAIGDSGGVVGINFHVGFLRSDGKRDPETPLLEIVRHVDYVAERIGIDHVAFGSDFDGATMPSDLRDVTGLPKLMSLMDEHGYDTAALEKIAQGNWLRVLRETWGE